MKRSVKALLIVGTTVTVLWSVARVTGALQYYRIPSPANEPTIKPGEHVFVSSFKELSPKCLIVFTSTYADSLNATYFEGYEPGARFLYRLCAAPGDLIEMKKGILFVNGENFDEGLDLKNQFKISVKEFETIIEEKDKLNDTGGDFIASRDSMLTAFDNQMVKKYQQKIHLARYIITDTTHGPFKWLDMNSAWTVDDFGPLKIPADCYFGLGDNRHNAMDSRFTGFIKKDDIKGVVLSK